VETVEVEPPAEFGVGALSVVVESQGLRSPLGVRRRVVYAVTVSDAAGHTWTARYGFEPPSHSVRAAADAALDELDRIHADPERWAAEWTAGFTPREAEAMRASRHTERDVEAAGWAGPLLGAHRALRARSGSWLPTQLP
jgi:hypothetical protein